MPPISAQIPPSSPAPTATVMGKSESGNSQSISIADGRSTSSLSRSGSLIPAFKKAFRQLQVGRAYVFPDAFHTPRDDSNEFDTANLLSLEQRLPFRALVDQIQVMEQRVVLRLCCTDGTKTEFVHTGTQDHDKAAGMVAGLQLEETYEFPAILKGEKPTPPANGGGPLAWYVGEWGGSLEGDPSFHITMNCAWTADGQGMWREIMYDDSSDAPPVHDVAIVSVHGGGSVLMARNPRQKDKPATETAYEESSRTFTTRLPSPEPGVVRINTATFTNEDTIAWKTVSQNAEGTVLAATSGSYRRLKREPQNASASASSPLNVPPALITALDPKTWAGTTLTTRDLLAVPNLPPFRATVVKRQISPTSIQLDLKLDDEITVTVGHASQENWDKAMAMVQHLEEGRTYEFPDALAEGYLAPPPGAVPQPASEAMRALAPFIGTWKGSMEADKKVTVRYFWKDDGTGLWKETKAVPVKADPDGKNKTDEVLRARPVLTTYDAARQCYVESPPLDIARTENVTNGILKVFHALSPSASSTRSQMSLWNAATRTYTWQHTQDQPQPNTQHSGTRRFVSPDRIEWESKVTAADGTVLQNNSGHYDRVSP
ncbi:hypothetical protein [Prosthecobacter sp.]